MKILSTIPKILRIIYKYLNSGSARYNIAGEQFMLSKKQKEGIIKLIHNVASELEKSGKKLFKEKPTGYVFLARDQIFISLLDEGKTKVQLILTDRPKRGIMTFFLSRFILDDFFSLDEGFIEQFARDKVLEYLDEIREDAAYFANLKRVKNLVTDGHYAVAMVFLISAFENAMKDVFFRNNEFWLFHLREPSVQLLNKHGIKLDEKDEGRFRTTIVLGDEKWGFTDEKYELFKKWETVLYKTRIFRICKQLGILEEYLLNLYANSLQEIGYFELLKKTLEGKKGRNPAIKFQMVDGKKGIKWSFNKFFLIDMQTIDKDLDVIKHAAIKRHKIIHGFLDDKQITQDYVEEVEASVRKAVAFVKNGILDWTYVL